jgi:hypothetical protein
MYITGSVTREDAVDCIDLIIDDNKFEKKVFLKECGISHMVKKLTIEHLIEICKHKGYSLNISIPDDTLSLEYYLENQELETENSSIDDLPEEFKKDSDEEDDLF